MKLLTKKDLQKLPKLYGTEKEKIKDKKAIIKFFNPCGVGTWYAVEGEKQDDDFIFWGLVDLHEKELGYFSLNELSSVKLPFGLRIERDIHFSPTLLNNFMGEK